MKPAIVQKWYTFLAARPCYRCGLHNSEIAHVKVLISPKTGDVLPRRCGIAVLGALPLCPDCHRHAPDSIHAIGEREFFERMETDRDGIGRHLAGLLAEFILSL